MKLPKLRPARTLPPELAQRALELKDNPDVYPFPSRTKILEGEPDQVNFDRVWSILANPVHWNDDSYHNDVQVQDPGRQDTHEGAWFEMTHRGFPLMPTVFGSQDFAGVIVDSKIDGAAGARVGKVTLAELNRSGESGWKAIPEHLQTLTVTEMEPGRVQLELGVKTAPSDSPEWLRKNFLRPWATWHIEIDEADKMRHLEQRVFPERDIPSNSMKQTTLLGAAGGTLAGLLLSSGQLSGAILGGAVGGALAYYLAGEQLRDS